MTTIRKPIIVKQAVSQPPPNFVRMRCQCGQIFSQSFKLTLHLFEKHICSPQFQKMRRVTEQSSTIDQFHKSHWSKNQQIKKKQQIYEDIFQAMSLGSSVLEKSKKNRGQSKQFQFDKLVQNSQDEMQLIQLNSQKERLELEDNRSPQATFSALSSSSNQVNNNQKNPNQIKRRRRRQQTRQFFNSRTFMCGQCLITFDYSAELNVHVSVIHNGQYPDGSIFGLKKNQILNFFKIPVQKHIYPQLPERERKFKCGCGCLYTASSSLIHHIKLRHNSVVPAGTINLPQPKRFKKIIVVDPDLPNAVQ